MRRSVIWAQHQLPVSYEIEMWQIPTFFIHPALLVERYSNSVCNSEVSWSANTFEDHGRWKFFAIGGDCECDCKAPLLGAARLHWNCSAATELKGSARRKLESHRSFIHIEQPGERMAIPLQILQILHIFKQEIWFEVSLFPSVIKTIKCMYLNLINYKD